VVLSAAARHASSEADTEAARAELTDLADALDQTARSLIASRAPLPPPDQNDPLRAIATATTLPGTGRRDGSPAYAQVPQLGHGDAIRVRFLEGGEQSWVVGRLARCTRSTRTTRAGDLSGHELVVSVPYRTHDIPPEHAVFVPDGMPVEMLTDAQLAADDYRDLRRRATVRDQNRALSSTEVPPGWVVPESPPTRLYWGDRVRITSGSGRDSTFSDATVESGPDFDGYYNTSTPGGRFPIASLVALPQPDTWVLTPDSAAATASAKRRTAPAARPPLAEQDTLFAIDPDPSSAVGAPAEARRIKAGSAPSPVSAQQAPPPEKNHSAQQPQTAAKDLVEAYLAPPPPAAGADHQTPPIGPLPSASSDDASLESPRRGEPGAPSHAVGTGHDDHGPHERPQENTRQGMPLGAADPDAIANAPHRPADSPARRAETSNTIAEILERAELDYQPMPQAQVNQQATALEAFRTGLPAAPTLMRKAAEDLQQWATLAAGARRPNAATLIEQAADAFITEAARADSATEPTTEERQTSDISPAKDSIAHITSRRPAAPAAAPGPRSEGEPSSPAHSMAAAPEPGPGSQDGAPSASNSAPMPVPDREDELDTQFPGWRDLPVFVDVPHGASDSAAATRRRDAWWAAAARVLPAGWLASGSPIRVHGGPAIHIPRTTPAHGSVIATTEAAHVQILQRGTTAEAVFSSSRRSGAPTDAEQLRSYWEHIRPLHPVANRATLPAARARSLTVARGEAFAYYRTAGAVQMLPVGGIIPGDADLLRVAKGREADSLAASLTALTYQPPFNAHRPRPDWTSPSIEADLLQCLADDTGEQMARERLHTLLLRTRARWDRERGDHQSAAASAWAQYEPDDAQQAPPEHHQWAHKLKEGDWVHIAVAGGETPQDVQVLAAQSDDATVELLVETGEGPAYALLPINRAVAEAEDSEAPDPRGTRSGTRVWTSELHPGDWIRIDLAADDRRLPASLPTVVRSSALTLVGQVRTDRTETALADVDAITLRGRRYRVRNWPLNGTRAIRLTSDAVAREQDERAADWPTSTVAPALDHTGEVVGARVPSAAIRTGDSVLLTARKGLFGHDQPYSIPITARVGRRRDGTWNLVDVQHAYGYNDELEGRAQVHFGVPPADVTLLCEVDESELRPLYTAVLQSGDLIQDPLDAESWLEVIQPRWTLTDAGRPEVVLARSLARGGAITTRSLPQRTVLGLPNGERRADLLLATMPYSTAVDAIEDLKILRYRAEDIIARTAGQSDPPSDASSAMDRVLAQITEADDAFAPNQPADMIRILAPIQLQVRQLKAASTDRSSDSLFDELVGALEHVQRRLQITLTGERSPEGTQDTLAAPHPMRRPTTEPEQVPNPVPGRSTTATTEGAPPRTDATQHRPQNHSPAGIQALLTDVKQDDAAAGIPTGPREASAAPADKDSPHTRPPSGATAVPPLLRPHITGPAHSIDPLPPATHPAAAQVVPARQRSVDSSSGQRQEGGAAGADPSPELTAPATSTAPGATTGSRKPSAATPSAAGNSAAPDQASVPNLSVWGKHYSGPTVPQELVNALREYIAEFEEMRDTDDGLVQPLRTWSVFARLDARTLHAKVDDGDGQTQLLLSMQDSPSVPVTTVTAADLDMPGALQILNTLLPGPRSTTPPHAPRATPDSPRRSVAKAERARALNATTEGANGPASPRPPRTREVLAHAQQLLADWRRSQEASSSQQDGPGTDHSTAHAPRTLADLRGDGVAPTEPTALTTALRQRGFQESELLAAGVSIQTSTGVQDRFSDSRTAPVLNDDGHVIALSAQPRGETAWRLTHDTDIFTQNTVLLVPGHDRDTAVTNSAVVLAPDLETARALDAAFRSQPPQHRGTPVVVAPAGQTLTAEQATALARLGRNRDLVVVTDRTPAGNHVLHRVWEHLHDWQGRAFAARLPAHPSEPRSAPAERAGADQLQKMRDHTEPLLEAVLDSLFDTQDQPSSKATTEAIRAVATVLLHADTVEGITGAVIRLQSRHNLDVGTLLRALEDTCAANPDAQDYSTAVQILRDTQAGTAGTDTIEPRRTPPITAVVPTIPGSDFESESSPPTPESASPLDPEQAHTSGHPSVTVDTATDVIENPDATHTREWPAFWLRRLPHELPTRTGALSSRSFVSAITQDLAAYLEPGPRHDSELVAAAAQALSHFAQKDADQALETLERAIARIPAGPGRIHALLRIHLRSPDGSAELPGPPAAQKQEDRHQWHTWTAAALGSSQRAGTPAGTRAHPGRVIAELDRQLDLSKFAARHNLALASAPAPAPALSHVDAALDLLQRTPGQHHMSRHWETIQGLRSQVALLEDALVPTTVSTHEPARQLVLRTVNAATCQRIARTAYELAQQLSNDGEGGSPAWVATRVLYRRADETQADLLGTQLPPELARRTTELEHQLIELAQELRTRRGTAISSTAEGVGTQSPGHTWWTSCNQALAEAQSTAGQFANRATATLWARTQRLWRALTQAWRGLDESRSPVPTSAPPAPFKAVWLRTVETMSDLLDTASARPGVDPTIRDVLRRARHRLEAHAEHIRGGPPADRQLRPASTGQRPPQREQPSTARALRAERRRIEGELAHRDLSPRERRSLQEAWIMCGDSEERLTFAPRSGTPAVLPLTPHEGSGEPPHLVAGSPPVPDPVAARTDLAQHLEVRADQQKHLYPETADLFRRVAIALRMEVCGYQVNAPTSDSRQILNPESLRALRVIAEAPDLVSPLILRDRLGVGYHRANGILASLELVNAVSAISAESGAAPTPRRARLNLRSPASAVQPACNGTSPAPSPETSTTGLAELSARPGGRAVATRERQAHSGTSGGAAEVGPKR